MCEKLEVSRSGFYAWLQRPVSSHDARDRELERVIARHFEDSGGIYGSPRVHALLRRQGYRVSCKRVARLMRAAGLVGAERANETTFAAFEQTYAPRGLRRDLFAPTYGLAEATLAAAS